MSHSRRRAARIGAFCFALALVIGASHGTTAAPGPSPAAALRQAWEAASAGGRGSYRFSSDIEQTLLPRARAENIGKSDQRIDMRAEGAVRLPDQAQLRLSFEGAPGTAPVGLVQDGSRTYIQAGD